MSLPSKNYPENRQKAPEQRPLSKEAKEILLNSVQPERYEAANDAKAVIEATVPGFMGDEAMERDRLTRAIVDGAYVRTMLDQVDA
jgi:hypothetical protein